MSASENRKNKNLVQVVALALRDSSTNEWLLARRGPGSSGAGEWEFPGGKIEAGETQQMALVREIKEELNFDMSEMNLEFVAEHTHCYPKRDIQIFLWRLNLSYRPRFVLTDHDAVAWYAVERIKEINLSSGDKYFISLIN